jgi:opacity protein-like surface antigen
MKWLVVVLLFAAMSAGASAQITFEQAQAETVIDAATFGSGWEIASNEVGGSQANPWDRRLIYYGPAGASIVVEAYHLQGGMFDSSLRVQMLLISWRVYASGSAPDGTDVPMDTDASPPDGVTDASRSEWIDPTKNAPIGYSIYGIQAANVLMVIRTEGTVNGLTGVAATDYVAGLYFAALSAE